MQEQASHVLKAAQVANHGVYGRNANEMGDVGPGDVVAIWGCGAPQHRTFLVPRP
jgi:hypothetical protein